MDALLDCVPDLGGPLEVSKLARGTCSGGGQAHSGDPLGGKTRSGGPLGRRLSTFGGLAREEARLTWSRLGPGL